MVAPRNVDGASSEDTTALNSVLSVCDMNAPRCRQNEMLSADDDISLARLTKRHANLFVDRESKTSRQSSRDTMIQQMVFAKSSLFYMQCFICSADNQSPRLAKFALDLAVLWRQ
jgi:hypothetical protein